MKRLITTLLILAPLAAAAAPPRPVRHPFPLVRLFSGWYDDWGNPDGWKNGGDPWNEWEENKAPAPCPQDPFQVPSDWLLGFRPSARIPEAPRTMPGPGAPLHPCMKGSK